MTSKAKKKPEPRPKSATDTVCPVKGCGGALWNITSRLAEGMGVMTLRCDACQKSWGVKTGDRR